MSRYLPAYTREVFQIAATHALCHSRTVPVVMILLALPGLLVGLR